MGRKSHKQRAKKRSLNQSKGSTRRVSTAAEGPDLRARLQRAGQLHVAGKLKEARDEYIAILDVDPANSQLLWLLSTVSRQLGESQAAFGYVHRAIAVQPNEFKFHEALGAVCESLGSATGAMAAWSRALQLKPDSLLAILKLACLCNDCKRYRDATRLFERAYELDPRNPHAIEGIVKMYEREARLDEAQAVVDQALISLPNNVELVTSAARIQHRKQNFARANNLLDDLQRVEPASHLNSNVAHARGVIHDSLGEYETAFQHFVRANELLANEIQIKPSVQNALETEIEEARRTFSPNWVEACSSDAPAAGFSPIFVFGFPRSGNTLLDQVLDCHTQLQTLMEKPLLQGVTRLIDANFGGYPRSLAALSHDQVEQCRQAYDRSAKRFIERDPRLQLVDSFPLNTFRAGLMIRLFPDAKLVFLQRHPCDVCLSSFMQMFRDRALVDAFGTIERTVEVYSNMMELWQQYRDVLSPKFHTIRYEDIVDDFDNTIQQLCTYLEIPWQDTMRQFDVHARKQGGLTTASYDQVTQGLYRRSRYRWKNYVEQLAPVLPRLDPYVRQFGYSLD